MIYNKNVYEFFVFVLDLVFKKNYVCKNYVCRRKINFWKKKIVDYIGGLLLYYNYFIGVDFDDIVVEYKWVINVLVDFSGFLFNYLVIRVIGYCLMWSDLDLLWDYFCSSVLFLICEILMGVLMGVLIV